MKTDTTTDTSANRRLVGIRRLDEDGTPILELSVCPRCSSRWFPARDVCANCASDHLETIASRGEGAAYASTVVRIAPKGFTAPYVLSYVDVDGIRLLAHTDPLDADDPRPLTPDTPVVLVGGPITTQGDLEFVSYRARAKEVAR